MSIVKNTPNFLKLSKLPFTTLLNKTIDLIKDPGALGIYLYLSSKSDDWEISETNLKNRFGKGRDYIRDRLSELKALGLIETFAIKDKKGRIVKWETVLYNEPHFPENPSSGEVHITEKPASGKTRHLEKPPTTNKRFKEIKEVSTKPPISPTGGVVREKEKYYLKLEDLKNQNPHKIPEELLREWFKARNKPVTPRVWESMNKAMMELDGNGINPADAFNKMLDKQWQSMEARYFAADIVYKNTKTKSPVKNKRYTMAEIWSA